MGKIFYNAQGWVCDRYPTNISVDDPNRYVEVDDDTYAKTFCTDVGRAWRVVNGELKNQICDKKEHQENELEAEKNLLKQEIVKIKEDVEQVELFGMERSDYVQKKARCVEIVERLRAIEQQLKELSKEGN